MTDLGGDDVAKLRRVFEEQFSLEILLKNEERRIIEAEKAKVEAAIQQLEQSVAIGGMHFYALSNSDVTYTESPSRYNHYYSQYVEYSVRSTSHYGATAAPSLVSSRPQRNAALKAASRNNSAGTICYARNDQGKVVKSAPFVSHTNSQSHMSRLQPFRLQ
jgi:hypothetical protein